MIPLDDALVPFQARRLDRPSLIYRNRAMAGMADDELLDRFAYVISDRKRDGIRAGAGKTFHAERYGGTGLLSNGGGVRCGLGDGYQVKGIGCNPLVGDGVDFWYRHGAVSTYEALKEVVWGEVLHDALPYGAVRVLAVIDTGMECWHLDAEDRRRKTRRALVVREAALRPGHFERAVYFRPKPEHRSRLLPDAERVRRVIQSLPELLPLPDGFAGAGRSVSDRLIAGLSEMLRRFADQLAAAKARRIMHGGLSSSNIGLDGRWLDYGSVSSLPGFAHTRNVNPGFWNDGIAIGIIVDNLCFYLGKYFEGCGRERLPQPRALMEFFERRYHETLRKEFVLSAGFPDFALDLSWRDCANELAALATVLVDMASAGTLKPFLGPAERLGEHGTYKMRRLLPTLAYWAGAEAMPERLAGLVPEIHLKNRLISSYDAVFRATERAAADKGIAPRDYRRLVFLNAAKRAQHVEELFEPRLQTHLRDFVSTAAFAQDAAGCAAREVARLVDKAHVAFSGTDDALATVARRGDRTIRFDAESGGFETRGSGSASRTAWEDGVASEWATDVFGAEFDAAKLGAV